MVCFAPTPPEPEGGIRFVPPLEPLLFVTNHSSLSFHPFFADLLHKELSVSSLDLSSYDGSQSPGSGGTLTPNCRTKRMRTSFKHHQLRTMKSYFAINQNPDAKDLKQLAQKTGLSKRVLQVRLRTIVFANFMFTNFEN